MRECTILPTATYYTNIVNTTYSYIAILQPNPELLQVRKVQVVLQ